MPSYYLVYVAAPSTGLTAAEWIPVVEGPLGNVEAYRAFESLQRQYDSGRTNADSMGSAAVIIVEPGKPHNVTRSFGYPVEREEIDLAIQKHALAEGETQRPPVEAGHFPHIKKSGK